MNSNKTAMDTKNAIKARRAIHTLYKHYRNHSRILTMSKKTFSTLAPSKPSVTTSSPSRKHFMRSRSHNSHTFLMRSKQLSVYKEEDVMETVMQLNSIMTGPNTTRRMMATPIKSTSRLSRTQRTFSTNKRKNLTTILAEPNNLFDGLRSKIANRKLILITMDTRTATELSKILKSTDDLSELQICQSILDDSSAKILSEGIAATLSLVHLELSSNQITYNGLSFIYRALQVNQSVTCLDMKSIPGLQKTLLSLALPDLQYTLQESKTVLFVSLAGNFIGNHGIRSLSDGIGSVISFNVACNGLTPKSLPHILQLIKNSPALNELDLSGNPLGNEVCVMLAKQVAECLSVQRIYLKKCDITESGIGKYFLFTYKNLTLKKLVLDNNNLKGKGFKNIERMLHHSRCKLVELSLSHCSLHDPEIFAIAKGLEGNVGITMLNLSHNEIRDDGAAQLAAALLPKMLSSSIKSLDLSYNRIGDIGGVELVKAMKVSKALETVNIAFNMLTEITGNELLEACSSMPSVKKVNVENNFISEGVLQAVLKEMSKTVKNRATLQLHTLRNTFANMDKPDENTGGMQETIQKVNDKTNDIEKALTRVAFQRAIYQEAWKSLVERENKRKMEVDAMLQKGDEMLEKISKKCQDVEADIEYETHKYDEKIYYLKRRRRHSLLAGQTLVNDLVSIKASILSKTLKHKLELIQWQLELRSTKERLYLYPYYKSNRQEYKRMVEYKSALIENHALEIQRWEDLPEKSSSEFPLKPPLRRNSVILRKNLYRKNNK